MQKYAVQEHVSKPSTKDATNRMIFVPARRPPKSGQKNRYNFSPYLDMARNSINFLPQILTTFGARRVLTHTLEKAVGETPLQAIERFRQEGTQLERVPLAYAGRLDPMASGKLLILIGDECKKQKHYHGLDKGYAFSVLFGVGSDTQDILGRLSFGEPVHPEKLALEQVARTLHGTHTLPYPHFSSKTVQGKPLHTWTLEGRLNEIDIPTKESRVYKLTCTEYTTKTTEEIYQEVLAKVNRVPTVTETSKALGADFRRVDVRADWELWRETFPEAEWAIATFDCTASSGTYMRSLAKLIGEQFNTPALAYSIQRTNIGRFQPLPFRSGFWRKRL